MSGRFRGNMWAITAAILLLFPNSASVLCIAPGGHVAIEDINSPCCASAHAARPAPQHEETGFGTTVCCKDCTDLFLTPNGRAAIFESYSGIIAGAATGESSVNHGPEDTAFSLFSQSMVGIIAASKPIWSPVPLRC